MARYRAQKHIQHSVTAASMWPKVVYAGGSGKRNETTGDPSVVNSRGYTFSNRLIRRSASGKSVDSLRNTISLWNGWPSNAGGSCQRCNEKQKRPE